MTSIFEKMRQTYPYRLNLVIANGSIPYQHAGHEVGGDAWLRLLAPRGIKALRKSVTVFPVLEEVRTDVFTRSHLSGIHFTGHLGEELEELPVAGLHLMGARLNQGSILVGCTAPEAKQTFLNLFVN